MRFVISQDQRELWRWRIVASNGRIVADSGEGYATKQNAERAVLMIHAFATVIQTAPVEYEQKRSNGHKATTSAVGQNLLTLAKKGVKW